MPSGKNYTSFILTDIDTIKKFVGQMSIEMFDYIDSHKQSNFILFYKHITHSDLATFGKATHPNSHDKNLLYYIETKDMLEIEKNTKKPFQTAHQSCIGLKTELYDLVGLPQPRETDPYKINDYMNVYVVNQNMNYFCTKYTKIVFGKLGKQIPSRSRSWNMNDLDVTLSTNQFTPIDLHVAVHGLGMEEDKDFHKIRHHIFKGDSVLLLFELNEKPIKNKDGTYIKTNNNMFLLFEKNPIFFNLIGEVNSDYVKYQERTRRRLINQVTAKSNALGNETLDDEVTRQQQSAWRMMLANEMMAYTQTPREVFCPFTYITIDFDKLGTLFVASHIKGFSDPNTTNEEKYDVNNGILICANADALFDKHLITIDENKQLKFSFLLDDIRLRQQLLLMQPIFTPILNEKRMKYIAYHRAVFEAKELERKRA